MTRQFKVILVGIGLAMPLLLDTVLAAQRAKQTPAAPIPAQIFTAKKAFVANAGGDEPFYEEPLFSGGPDRSYNQIYGALKALGRYELVSTPYDADLLLEIRLTVPRIDQKIVRGETVLFTIPYDPQVRLVIRDPKTNAVLWAFTEHAEWAIRQANRDRNLDQAVARLVGDVQRLSTQPTVPTGGPDKQ